MQAFEDSLLFCKHPRVFVAASKTAAKGTFSLLDRTAIFSSPPSFGRAFRVFVKFLKNRSIVFTRFGIVNLCGIARPIVFNQFAGLAIDIHGSPAYSFQMTFFFDTRQFDAMSFGINPRLRCPRISRYLVIRPPVYFIRTELC